MPRSGVDASTGLARLRGPCACTARRRANPEERPTASQLLQHPFLQGEPLPSPPHEVAAFMEATVAASRRLEALIKDVVAPVRPAPAPMTLGFGAW